MGILTISAPDYILANIREKKWSPSALFALGYETQKGGVKSADYEKSIMELQKRVEFFAGRLSETQLRLWKMEETQCKK